VTIVDSGANSGSLGDLQRAFQDYLLVRSDGFAAAVRDTAKADRSTLLAVYRDAYALRLIEVLTNDYPGLLAMAGPADFDHMARAYIAAHPSHHPSVRWFGARLGDFLAHAAPFSGSPDAVEMARFEWALGEAFDAADAEPVTADMLMALPPEAWGELTFKALPSVRRLTHTFAIPQAWQRREDVEPGNLEVEAEATPVEWVIWRPELTSNFRSLDTDEAVIFDALMAGRNFPEICETMTAFAGEEGALPRVAGLLRAWIEEGMIASFHYSKSEA
jgi:hypothetical protein